jgi:acyl carrier protein
MAQADTAQRLAVMMSDVFGKEVDPTALNANLQEAYGANSMDTVDLVEHIEHEFGITIRDQHIEQLVTFADVVRVVTDSSNVIPQDLGNVK